MSGSSDQREPDASARAVSFDDRLRAEALRFIERDDAARIDDRNAVEAARAEGGSFEARIAHRARIIARDLKLDEAVDHVTRIVGWLIAIGCLLSFFAGAAAARGALGGQVDRPVNFYEAFLILLALQTVLLVIWIALLFIARRSAGMTVLGSVVMSLAQRISARFLRGRHHNAAAGAYLTTHGRSAIGRWMTGQISHGLWFCFNLGCLIMLLVLLSIRDYTFGWESTILDESSYAPLTRAIAALPEAIGFATPTDEQIEASRWTGDGALPESARTEWSQLLIGCVVAYALLPRMLLLGLSRVQIGRARQRYRIDTTRPEFQRLRPRLMIEARTEAVVPDEYEELETSMASAHEAIAPGDGPPCIVAVEMAPPATGWPPRISGMPCTDLGVVTSREDRVRVVDQLTHFHERPSCIIVVCSLTTTPDRGIGSFLERLSRTGQTPLQLLLTAGESLRKRNPHVEAVSQRIADWRALAHSVGIDDDAVLETDLDHLTDASAQRVRAWIGGETSPSSSTDSLDRAFKSIDDAARSWREAPSLEEKTKLHHSIANIYQSRAGDWRHAFQFEEITIDSIADSMRSTATRVTNLLPGNLRASPRWALAGAICGGMACLTAATLAAPAAIGMLPIWSAAGAAMSFLIQQALSHRESSQDESQDNPQINDDVRAAVLFALLLELQGHDEARITRMLESIIPPEDDEDLDLTDDEPRRDWLRTIAQRTRDARAREAHI